MGSYKVDLDRLPDGYPTNLHEREFWEQLGRVVASFGFLEEVLLRAIVALTFTREISDAELEHESAKAAQTLKKAASDTLSPLITEYVRLAALHQSFPISNLTEFEKDLRAATTYRNVMCHGFWQAPDDAGKSVPHFVNRRGEKWDAAVDIDFLREMQKHSSELAMEVVNSITLMGWAFPGTTGPGKRLLGDEPD